MRVQFLSDLRYALRMLSKSRGVTAVIVMMLAAGIFGNTAIFSIANAPLIRRVPYGNPDQLVIVTQARGANRMSFSNVRAAFLRDRGRSFSGFAPFVTENFNLTGRGEPEILPAAR